jgi:hypothetical protein
MGNITSSNSNKAAETEFKNFYDVIDYIATYYILTMDFKSLSKLSEKAYCDKLVVLTSDIIQRYFNDMEITYLAQRIKDGVEVNDLNKEKVIFINKDNLEGLDISNDAQKSIKKKRVCIGIAKFYVKIAHIFAAIVMTINPVYTYKDATGQTVKTGLLEKDKIPKNVNRKLYKLNICDNRIRALKKGEQIDDVTGNVTLQPKVCDMNVTKTGLDKTLADEPGITELMRLYLDDNYDYSNGNFTGMSDSTKSQFMKDLKLFYTAFTGNETMPPEITKFSDIKLRDYNKKSGCQGATPVLKNKYTLNKKDQLFLDYAENTKKMIQTAADNQSKLLSVINELFTYVIDPYSGKKVIRINPKLNDELLQKAVEKTRRFIVDLYIKCETDYVNGIKLYEAIVESKILETTQKQIDNLKNEAKKIITETQTATAPVVQKPVAVVVAGPSSSISSSSTNVPSTPSVPSSSTNVSSTPSISSSSTNVSSTPSMPSSSTNVSSTSSTVPSTSTNVSSTLSTVPSTSTNVSSTPSVTNSSTTINNSIVSPASTIPSSIPTPPSITGQTQLATSSLTSTA